jgi:CarD family transcriptional regulator
VGAIDAFPSGSALFVELWTVADAEQQRTVEASRQYHSVRLRETDMMSEKALFATGDLVVYPTHGVGKIVGIEAQEIAGLTLNVFVVHFDKDRMTLRVPLGKAKVSGLRRLSSRKEMDAALAKLRGRSRAKRTMWSRRAQEYQAKIASGDPASIAEVVRDLYRNSGQPEQSYSERQIYQSALDRLVREFAAVERIDETTATQRVEQLLAA